MSRVPLLVVGALVAMTVGLVKYAGWDPKVAAIVVAAAALLFIASVAGVALLLMPAADRQRFHQTVFNTAAKDANEIVDQMKLRR